MTYQPIKLFDIWDTDRGTRVMQIEHDDLESAIAWARKLVSDPRFSGTVTARNIFVCAAD